MSRGVPRYLIIKKRKKKKEKKLLRGGGAKFSPAEASGALNAGWRDLRLMEDVSDTEGEG